MFPDNRIVREDLDDIVERMKLFQHSWSGVYLVTGATGLIGKFLVMALLAFSDNTHAKIKVIAQGRSIERLRSAYFSYRGNPNLELLECDLAKDGLKGIASKVEYVIHAASPTSSSDFVMRPVEVINDIFTGTRNMLSFCRKENVKSFLFLSSMEVYGTIEENIAIKENTIGALDFCSVRSSYPQAKRLSELLCISYSQEYQVPTKIARLGMIFGPGINIEDNRVLMYFIRQIINQQPIKLNTQGKSMASVLYLSEATLGLLLLLMRGKNAEAYNLSNPENYMSIYQMASCAAKEGKISIELPEKTQAPAVGYYRKDSYLNLDITKMRELGWIPRIKLETILKRVCQSLSND